MVCFLTTFDSNKMKMMVLRIIEILITNIIETNFNNLLDFSWSQNEDATDKKGDRITATDGAEVTNTPNNHDTFTYLVKLNLQFKELFKKKSFNLPENQRFLFESSLSIDVTLK